jgi:hypothetical protein
MPSSLVVYISGRLNRSPPTDWMVDNNLVYVFASLINEYYLISIAFLAEGGICCLRARFRWVDMLEGEFRVFIDNREIELVDGFSDIDFRP